MYVITTRNDKAYVENLYQYIGTEKQYTDIGVEANCLGKIAIIEMNKELGKNGT